MTIQSELKKQLKRKFEDRVRFDEPMSVHTAFRVGGPADAFVTVTNESEMAFVSKWTEENNLPFFIIGGGTNLLVKDRGIRGVVVAMARELAKISFQGTDRIAAMAGAGLSTLCRFAMHHGLGGLNFAFGIPGTVGGAVRMNAGAWGSDMSSVVHGIRVMEPGGHISSREKRELSFSYRNLSFEKQDAKDRSLVILKTTFQLLPADPELLKNEADALLKARKKSQPTALASAGCFFKNPENRESAGRLIDLAGGKNIRVGDAQVSDKHANFIVNTGRATAEDILRLMETVREMVFKKFNIELEPEVKIVGD